MRKSEISAIYRRSPLSGNVIKLTQGLDARVIIVSSVLKIPKEDHIGRLGAKAEIRATDDVDFKEKNICFEGISFIGDIKPVISND